MPKERLDCHPSVVVAYSAMEKKFLMSIYDEGYPRKAYRLSANNIGGNPEAEDRIPENLLLKEIAEEFDPNHSEEKQHVGKVLWAPDYHIRFIRNGLMAKVQPLQDFLVRQPEVIEGGNKPYQGIYSVFHTTLCGDVIEMIEDGLSKQYNFTTEGLLGVFSLEDLEESPRGEFSTAHITAHILNWKYGSKIPHPKQLTAEPIGLPRKTYRDYLSDFEYSQENLKKASTADFG